MRLPSMPPIKDSVDSRVFNKWPSPWKDGGDGTGFYPTQYIFEKAYGNYLGLCQLGTFIAHEIGVSLEGIRCFVNHPVAGNPRKTNLRDLEKEIGEIADRYEARNA
jgi:hypothetical protein